MIIDKIKLTYNKYWIISCLLLCVISRLLTAIYYIEDPDSLQFALASKEFDITKLQPHFPGYLVFCFILQIFTLITGKFSIAFSLIGGISVFLIIWSCRTIAGYLIPEIKLWVLDLLIFFNPLLWLMSNRYMPDVIGLAIIVLCFFLFIETEKKQSKNHLLLFQLFTGIAAGIRLSYMPLLIVPVLYLIYTKRNKILQVIALLTGTAVWMVPLIAITGWNNLIDCASEQTSGHFYTWGGTIVTNHSYSERIIFFIKNIWADGFGAYWLHRHWVTLFIALGFVIGILQFVLKYKWVHERCIAHQKKLILILAVSFFLYVIWIFLYQNIIHNPRHLLPLVIFFSVVLTVGFSIFSYSYKVLCYLTLVYFLAAYVSVCGVLVYQHKSPAAMAEVLNYMRKIPDPDKTVISISLVNYFFSQQGIKANFLNVEDDKDQINEAFLSDLKQDKKIFLIGIIPDYVKATPKRKKIFYHNPYVNKMWSKVVLYEF